MQGSKDLHSAMGPDSQTCIPLKEKKCWGIQGVFKGMDDSRKKKKKKALNKYINKTRFEIFKSEIPFHFCPWIAL